jgi:hypothetical protein
LAIRRQAGLSHQRTAVALERGEINVNDVLSRLRKAEDDHE